MSQIVMQAVALALAASMLAIPCCSFAAGTADSAATGASAQARSVTHAAPAGHSTEHQEVVFYSWLFLDPLVGATIDNAMHGALPSRVLHDPSLIARIANDVQETGVHGNFDPVAIRLVVLNSSQQIVYVDRNGVASCLKKVYVIPNEKISDIQTALSPLFAPRKF